MTPLFVRDTSAAKMLDMPTKEFRQLVKEGKLPGPVKLDRWDVEQLKDIMRGRAHRPRTGFEL